MSYPTGPGTIIGQARIIAYDVSLEGVSYVIAVRECLQEFPERFEEIPDFQIEMAIPFGPSGERLIEWLQNPAFVAIRESWTAHEDKCYFEYCPTELTAFMIVNGVEMTLPVTSTPPATQQPL